MFDSDKTTIGRTLRIEIDEEHKRVLIYAGDNLRLVLTIKEAKALSFDLHTLLQDYDTTVS